MNRSRVTLTGMLLTSAALVAFVVTKAWSLGITWDEAFTFLEFIDRGRMYPGAGGGMAANNHLLNTWLAAISTLLFGPGEFALRIPNLIFYLVYLYFTGRTVLESGLCKGFFPAAVAAFLLFNTNPYLVDFFCLARGYGISFALLSGSMYFILRYTGRRNPSDYRTGVLLAMGAVLANLALLHFALVIFFVPVFLSWIKHHDKEVDLPGTGSRSILKSNPLWLNAGFAGFMTCFIVYGFVLQRYGALFYGGTKGFVHDSVHSVAVRSLYEQDYGVISPAAITVACLLFVVLVMATAVRRQPVNGTPAAGRYKVSLIILAACAGLSIVQHYVFGSLFLFERSALFLWILLVYLFVTFTDALAQRWKWVPVFILLLSAAMTVHLVRSADTRYVLEWKRDADVKEMLSDLARQKTVCFYGKPTIRVGASLEYELPFNYYIHNDSLSWLAPVRRRGFLQPGNDFYVLDRHDLASVTESTRRIREYPLSQAVLLVRTP